MLGHIAGLACVTGLCSRGMGFRGGSPSWLGLGLSLPSGLPAFCGTSAVSMSMSMSRPSGRGVSALGGTATALSSRGRPSACCSRPATGRGRPSILISRPASAANSGQHSRNTSQDCQGSAAISGCEFGTPR